MGKKALYWQPHVEGWRRSGRAITAYCREHGLDVKRFAYWRRRLGSAQIDAAPVALVPIQVHEAVRTEHSLAIHLPNGLQVHVSMDGPGLSLATLIRELSTC
jgi:hypothetical protein